MGSNKTMERSKQIILILIMLIFAGQVQAAKLAWDYDSPRDNIIFEVWYKIGSVDGAWKWLDRTLELEMEIPDDQIYPCYFYVVAAWIEYPTGTDFQSVPSLPALYLPESPQDLKDVRLSKTPTDEEPPAIPTEFMGEWVLDEGY